jgi:HCOMODA/2-hydroxy-3-carboxy-muconic semialdehyde decarboxylase
MVALVTQARYELALANRIVAHEGVIDAFGHVSMRHPGDASRYLISRSRSPELVEPADILEFTLDSEPVRPLTVRPYGELVIHGCIYQARSDVMAVCHHHADAVLPFCATGMELLPIYHLGATMGEKVPFWDSRDEFGDTNLLVLSPQEGRSLAKALGAHSMVLMRRHGATVVARSLQELVFRTIFSCRNAELQLRAQSIGALAPLNAGERTAAEARTLEPRPLARAWEYWTVRLEKAGALPPGQPKRGAKAKSRGAAKRAKATAKRR